MSLKTGRFPVFAAFRGSHLQQFIHISCQLAVANLYIIPVFGLFVEGRGVPVEFVGLENISLLIAARAQGDGDNREQRNEC